MTCWHRRGVRRLWRRHFVRLTIGAALCAVAPLAGAATAEAAPTASISDVTVTEGNAGSTTASFTVQLSEPSLMAVSVDAQTVTGTAVGGDFGRRATSAITFSPGQTSKAYNVNVNGDLIDEVNETFTVQLSNPSTGLTIADGIGQATITDDDAPSTISVGDVSLSEPGSTYDNASFTVSLNQRSEKPISVRLDTVSGTASTDDYSPRANVIVDFPAGATSRTVRVPVRPGDTIDELNETFHLDASSPVNATIADGRGTATITDDDAPPTIAINDTTMLEPHPDYGNQIFTLSLSQPSGKTITVLASTGAGSATTADFSARTNVLVTFPAGATTRQFAVPVRPDFTDEFDETFTVGLSGATNVTVADGSGTGTITDDDAPPEVTISDVTVAEPVSGDTSARVAVTLNRPSGKPVTVQHSTADGSATGGSDYQIRTNNTVTIPAGNTQTTVGVNVHADNFREGDEQFTRAISNATNALINDGFGVTTISAHCHDKEPNSFATAMDIGSVAGDSGAEQVFSPAGASICANDVDWYKVQLREADGPGDVSHTALVHLDVPDVAMNGDLDLFVYDSDGTLFDSSESTGTADEDVLYSYDDTVDDDSDYFWVAVAGFPDPATSAPAVNDYTLTVTGNQ